MKRLPVDADSPTNYRAIGWLFFWLTLAYGIACVLKALGVWH